MRVLSAEDVRRALPMPEAIEAMKQAFADLTAKRAVVPERIHLDVRPHDGVSLVMPAFVNGDHGQALAVKVVSLFENNLIRGIARIQAAVVVLEPDTGRLRALLEGSALTAIRTAAASGAATDLLARHESRTLAVLGAGVQARSHLEAVCSVRAIRTAWVYSRTSAKTRVLIDELAGVGPIPQDLRVAASAKEAVQQADIVCTATTSRTPVFDDADLRAGVHVNAVGSFQPDVCEVPAETVVRSRVIVDSREAAWAEAGDLIQPLQSGRINSTHVRAELGDLVLATQPGRTDPEQLTLFKSVGVAVQDAVAARVALKRAEETGLGQQLPW